MSSLLKKSLEIFGDKLSIKHKSILHQEGSLSNPFPKSGMLIGKLVNSQVFLIVAGYIHRADASHLSTVARSSLYINAISNRLAASSPRAALLGMIVGTAISELVDPIDKLMKFSVEDIDSAEGQWYRSLTRIEDQVGSIGNLKPNSTSSRSTGARIKTRMPAQEKPSKSSNQTSLKSQILSIEEIDDSDSEEEFLPLHQKPDSDPSDSDEDPTLIQRNRPIAPVSVLP